MKQYLEILKNCLENGVEKTDRTGTGTIGYFGEMKKYNMLDGFPLVTTKKLSIKSILHELLWFIKGDTNIKYLNDNGVSIWDEWADENGDLGPVYGKQWREWEANGVKIDQLQWAINRLKTNPDCRRVIVSAWNVADLGKMALMPCHAMFQFNTSPLSALERVQALCFRDLHNEVAELLNDDLTEEEVKFFKEKRKNIRADVCDTHEYLAEEACKREISLDGYLDELGAPKFALDLMLTQRSCDSMLGVPYNIASYSFLLHMVAQLVNMMPRNFVHSMGDVHVYSNHVEQTQVQLTREPYELPFLVITNNGAESINDFKFEDFHIVGYQAHPHIKADVAV